MQERHEHARGNRLKFLALVAVFAAPVLGATAWFFIAPYAAPPAAAHGELIHPARALDPFELDLAEDRVWDLAAMRGKWTMVQVVDAACDDACRQRIHYTRQIRDALGHDRVRVRRLLVAGPDAAAWSADAAGFLAGHPDLIVARERDDGGFVGQLPGAPGPRIVYLVDPLGNVMLRFAPDVAPSDILSDIKKVLRLSRIG